MEYYDPAVVNGIVLPEMKTDFRETGKENDVHFEKIRQLQTLLEGSEWARAEAEHRVTTLEQELLTAKRNEIGYREAISQLNFELNECRLSRASVTDPLILPPPPEFRTKSKSCTQLLTADYNGPSFPQTSLSVGDIESEGEQEDDVFAEGHDGRISRASTALPSGQTDRPRKDMSGQKLLRVETEREKLIKCIKREICKSKEESVLANKSITEVNKKIQYFVEISCQCPLTDLLDKTIPSHIKGMGVEILKSLDDRVWDFSLSLLADHSTLTRLREDLDFYEDFSGLFWSVISEWNRRCTGGRRATMLGQLIHACTDCHIINPLHADPVAPEDLCILEDCYPVLREHLLVPLVLIYLRDSALLSSSLVQYILEPPSSAEQAIRLLDIMPIFGPRAADILIRALKRSDQDHIADIIVKSNPGRFQDTPDSPPPQQRHVPVLSASIRSPRVDNSIKMFPQQFLGGSIRKSFFRRPKWLFRSGKYQFNKKQ